MSPEMRQALYQVKHFNDFSQFNQASEIIALRAARHGRLQPAGVYPDQHYGIQRFIYNAPLAEGKDGKIVAIEWNIHCNHCASGTVMVAGAIYDCQECGGDGWVLSETISTDLAGNRIELDF